MSFLHKNDVKGMLVISQFEEAKMRQNDKLMLWCLSWCLIRDIGAKIVVDVVSF